MRLSRIRSTLKISLALLISPSFGQELPDSMNLLESGGNSTAARPSVPLQRPSVPSPSSGSQTPSSQSTSKVHRADSDPALRVAMRFIQHQKMQETQIHSPSRSAGSPPSSLLPNPSAPRPTNDTPSSQGEIILSQAFFDGYISFMSRARQFGALEFSLPIRQIRSHYSGRNSGSEFGGMDLALVAGERGVGSFGVGAQYFQSSTLRIVEKHSKLKGFFYLERGGLSHSRKESRFHVQMGPELYVPLSTSTQTQSNTFEYSPIYGGKIQIGFLSNLGFDNLIRLKGFSHYYRVNKARYNKDEIEGGGLMSAGASLDYNVSGDLWLGVEGQWALTKPKGREYVFGNPELPALYGNSLGIYIQAAAF